jgi:hypothetical protein
MIDSSSAGKAKEMLGIVRVEGSARVLIPVVAATESGKFQSAVLTLLCLLRVVSLTGYH